MYSSADEAVRFEKATLGAVLLNPAHWLELSDLCPEDFSLDVHRRIYSRMCELNQSRRPIDIVTLTNELNSHELAAIGDVVYLSDLLCGLPDMPAASIRHYVGQVRRHAALRRIAAETVAVSEATKQHGASVSMLRDRLAEILVRTDAFQDPERSRVTRIEDIPEPFSMWARLADLSRWVVPGLFPQRGITVIAGEPGIGKTWLALVLARAATMGERFLGRPTAAVDVLLLDRENPLGLMCERLRILWGNTCPLHPWGLWCQDEPPLIGDRRLVDFSRLGPLIIFDSLIRFHQADENSASSMAPVMTFLRELASAGATVLVLHHKPKSETSAYRGSSEIVAAADVALSLGKRQDLLELRTIKNRFSAGETIRIRADFSTGSLIDVCCPPEGTDKDADIDRIASIIGASPGLTQNSVVSNAEMQRQRAIQLLHQHDGSFWRSEQGPNRSRRYSPVLNRVLQLSDQNRSFRHSRSGSHTDSHWQEPTGTIGVVPVLPPFMGADREPQRYYGA